MASNSHQKKLYSLSQTRFVQKIQDYVDNKWDGRVGLPAYMDIAALHHQQPKLVENEVGCMVPACLASIVDTLLITTYKKNCRSNWKHYFTRDVRSGANINASGQQLPTGPPCSIDGVR